MSKETRTCSSCVMPETAESLAFDECGTCSVCKQIDFKQDGIDWEQRKKDLHKIVITVIEKFSTKTYRAMLYWNTCAKFQGKILKLRGV